METVTTPDFLLELIHITRTFREGDDQRSVLSGLNAGVRRGDFNILLGRSGSGKSTLLNIISGIDLPDSGRVVVDGIDLTALSEKERTLFRRRHIGFIFQSLNLIPTLTVAENVLLPLELNGRTNPDENKKALLFLDKVGLGDRLSSYPDRLSGGEQQRVAIARALAHDPLLILADEPTGNLDYHTGRLVMDLLYQLVREMGKTVFLVTHDRELIDVADQVFQLIDGKLVNGVMEVR